jgi:glycosyltransferase involved in cell wall biosynthesis
MHRLNKNRFKKVSAAIVTSQGQKEVLKKYVCENKIFVIPLGIHLEYSNHIYLQLGALNKNNIKPYVVVLGNWLRDWDLLVSVLDIVQIIRPDLYFVLVNKKLDKNTRERLSVCTNVEIKKEVSRSELLELLYFAELNFLPLKSAAGNNALIEGLAMGCPAIISMEGNDVLHNEEVVVKYRRKNASELGQEIISSISSVNRERIRAACYDYAQQFDWKEIAERTKLVYNSVL